MITWPRLQLYTLVCGFYSSAIFWWLCSRWTEKKLEREAVSVIQEATGKHVLPARFRSAALPMGFGAAMTACVVCDQRLKDLIEVCGTARPPGQYQHANGGPARGDSRLRGGVAGAGRVGGGGHGAAGAGTALCQSLRHGLQCTSMFTCCHRLSCSGVWHSAACCVLTLYGLQIACNPLDWGGPHTHMRSAACSGCQQGVEGPQGADEAARTAAVGRERAAVQQQQGMRTASHVGPLPDWLWWRLLAVGLSKDFTPPGTQCEIPAQEAQRSFP